MASGIKSVFSGTQSLRCPICLDVFTAPKNLPCLHTYCQHCLHKYIVNNVPKGQKGSSFNCPECRKETFPSLPDIPVDKWAEHYPFNTVLLSVLPPDKRKVDKSCDSCLYEGNCLQATSYCTVCKEALCPTCESVHKKNKATRNHTFVQIQDLFANPEIAVNLSVSVTCPDHVGKEFEFYCKPHSSMCCSECFYKSHRACKEVLQIRDHTERLLKEKESNRAVDRLKQLKSHLHKFKNENRGSFEKIESEVKNMPNEIEELRNKINTLLDNVKAKITMEKNALLKEESIVRHDENQQCDSISSAITNSLHLLETVLAHGNPLHALTALHKIEEHLVHYESTVKEKYWEVRDVDAKLCLDDSLSAFVKNKNSQNSIAEIKVAEKRHSIRPSFIPPNIEKQIKATEVRQDAFPTIKKTTEGQKTTQKLISPKSLKDCKPRQIGQINASYLDGTTPGYSSIKCLPDDKIILVDYDNSKCRLYDPSHQHLVDYKMTSRPSGVCVVEGSQVAVTLPVENKIEFLTVDSAIKPRKIIKTSMGCDAIAALSSNQLVVIGKRSDILYCCIISTDGSEKSSFKVCHSKRSSDLAVNNQKSRIYISYYDPGAVYAYDTNGKLIFKYTHEALAGAYGIAVDREDNVYVVGELSYNIHQVSTSGRPMQVFLGIPIYAHAICFVSNSNEFHITDGFDIVHFHLV
ncbi:hypothetical protein ACJMK2_005735 [Sinanodonta woodiana]|uniref:Uncharacterized protein n=1 Tax=Sinanodonta woodiana TaxID=1069815 RepID=A0ABD3VTR0_SINWO